MQVSDIIDGIIAKKESCGMTAQQIADQSNVPKSTVDRILRKATDNPAMQTVLDMAAAVGYTIGDPVPTLTPEPPEGDGSPYLNHIISMYERQLADKDAAHAREMAKQERQYNLVTAEKNRWIQTLAIIVGILGIGVVSILLIDILNPTVGWFRRELAQYTNPSTSDWGSIVLMIRGWFGI